MWSRTTVLTASVPDLGGRLFRDPGGPPSAGGHEIRGRSIFSEMLVRDCLSNGVIHANAWRGFFLEIKRIFFQRPQNSPVTARQDEFRKQPTKFKQIRPFVTTSPARAVGSVTNGRICLFTPPLSELGNPQFLQGLTSRSHSRRKQRPDQASNCRQGRSGDNKGRWRKRASRNSQHR